MPAAPREVVDLLSGHRRIVLVTLAVVLGGMTIMAVVQIAQAFTTHHRQTARTLDDALLRIQPFVAGVFHQVDAMRQRVEEALRSGDPSGEAQVARLTQVAPGRFAIANLAPATSVIDAANCTGIGDLASLSPEQRRQLASAFTLDPLLRIGRNNLSEIAWAYLTTSWFIHIHPWRPAEDYAFWMDQALLKQEFFVRAGPQANPEHDAFWTSAYRDGAGLGLMVTCSAPVYDGRNFVGAVSADVTIDGLNRMLRAVAVDAGGEVLLCNAKGQVLSGPRVTSADARVSDLAEALPTGIHLTIQQVMAMPSLTPSTIDGHLTMVAEVPGTGWHLLVVQPVGQVWSHVLGGVVPWLVLSLGIVLTALVTAAVMIRRAYVLPAQRLVQHITTLAHGADTADSAGTATTHIPLYWQPWFAEVAKVFQANHGLLRQVQQAKEDLSRQVDERTRELSTKNHELESALGSLRRMQDTLVEREKLASLGHLVAGLAHELNTPMGVALGAATHLVGLVTRMTASARDGQVLRGDLDRFIADAERAGNLVESNLAQAARLVRSFKRVSADQASGERRTIDLPSYLSEVMTSLSGLLHRQHTVRLRPTAPIEIDTCPGALTQVIANLVENAVVHAFPEGRSGTITLVAQDLSNRIRITFQDDGVGMSDDVRARLFEPFFTTRRGQGGTGLGLSILYTLVTGTLGGEVTCDSAVGVGTTFTIELPRTPSQL